MAVGPPPSSSSSSSSSSTTSSNKKRRLLGPTSLAVAVLGGAVAALVARLMPRAVHDPSVPSHFAASSGGASSLLLGPGVQAERVPVELGGAAVEATVLVSPAAPAAPAASEGAKQKKKQPQQQQQQQPPHTHKPVVLMLHGFPDDALTFHAQVGPLNAAGYDVLIPVLPGYEPSTAGQPASAYSLPSIAQALAQVAEWGMRARGASQVHLVGHDWGAALAHILAAADGPLAGDKEDGRRRRRRVASVVTLAVPHDAPRGFLQHPRQFLNSWYMVWFQCPLLPELWFTGLGFFGLRKLWRDWSPGFRPEPAVFASLEATFTEPGVLAAALQYYRTNVPGMLQGMLQSLLASRQGKGETDRGPGAAGTGMGTVVRAPTLAISGLNDGCVSTRIYDLTMGGDGERGDPAIRHDHPLFPAGVQVQKLAGAGHFAHQERPEAVNAWMLEWFARHEGGDGDGEGEETGK